MEELCVSVCMYPQSGKGSEFSKRLSSMWAKQLLIFVSGTLCHTTRTHAHTGLAFVFPAPVWLLTVSMFPCIGFFEALNTFSAGS